MNNASSSVIDTAALAYAKGLLKPPIRRAKGGPVLLAAAFAAVCALAFAVSMVLAPPAKTRHIDRTIGSPALKPDPAKPL